MLDNLDNKVQFKSQPPITALSNFKFKSINSEIYLGAYIIYFK